MLKTVERKMKSFYRLIVSEFPHWYLKGVSIECAMPTSGAISNVFFLRQSKIEVLLPTKVQELRYTGYKSRTTRLFKALSALLQAGANQEAVKPQRGND